LEHIFQIIRLYLLYMLSRMSSDRPFAPSLPRLEDRDLLQEYCNKYAKIAGASSVWSE